MPVTLTLMCGRHQGIVVVASAMTVSTTQKVSIANDVSQASTGTSEDLSLPQMLANVSELMVTGKKKKVDLYKRDDSPSFICSRMGERS